MDSNILITTLGASWAVVPESLAVLDATACPLLCNSNNLAQFRSTINCNSISEMWVVTSSGQAPRDGINAIKEWMSHLAAAPILRCWQLGGSNNMDSESELGAMRELILRLVLKANEYGSTLISLAGGRKTMSADMQYAASILGCRGLFHVVVKDFSALPPTHEPALWSKALNASAADQVVPAYIGTYSASELLHVGSAGADFVTSRRFPLPMAPSNGEPISWTGESHDLSNELQSRQKEGARLTHNFIKQLASSDHHGSFRHLYRLQPLEIERLRERRVDDKSRTWLRQLPKAELHCHLGGLLDINGQRRCAEAIWQTMSNNQQRHAIDSLTALIQRHQDWLPELRHAERELRPELVAACFHLTDDEKLHQLLYGSTSRIALKNSPTGFSAYERPGELTGSAVLGHASALEPYVEGIKAYADGDNIRYLELRGSPHKYSDDPVRWVRQFRDTLADPRIRLIWVVDRRNPKLAAQCVRWAVEAYESMGGFVVGLDLAGDENQTPAAELQDAFALAFSVCMPLTIHAGEGQPSQQIWEAAYRLHADRVGHGLTLNDDARLRERFRNRSISIECCPTSNLQVVGYNDQSIPETQCYPYHPWRELWDAGVSVTLNTDNPGISETCLTDEYLTAARMHPKGMTHWEALGLIRQSFVRAMLPANERERLTKDIDSEIFMQLAQQKEILVQ